MSTMIDSLMPIFATLIVFSIPLAIIFSRHQQKMTLILRDRSSSEEELALQRQVQDLAYLVARQSSAIDSMARTLDRMEQREGLPERLSNRS